MGMMARLLYWPASSRGGGTGRRTRLKIWWERSRVGSIPALGTNQMKGLQRCGPFDFWSRFLLVPDLCHSYPQHAASPASRRTPPDRPSREGTRAYFKAETRSPVFPELRQLFEKTAGLIPILEQMLRPFGNKIHCAFVYGSVARGQEHAMSDVDLMIIGRAGLADLSPALRKAEARLGREINVTAYSPQEFREKVKSRDHFLTTVLRGRQRFVKGGRNDLDEAVGK